jgi:hypothetical protein
MKNFPKKFGTPPGGVVEKSCGALYIVRTPYTYTDWERRPAGRKRSQAQHFGTKATMCMNWTKANERESEYSVCMHDNVQRYQAPGRLALFKSLNSIRQSSSSVIPSTHTHQKPPEFLQFSLSPVLQSSILKMFTLMLRAYAITAVIFLTFSVQPSAAEDCNEQNGCVQHCGMSIQAGFDVSKTNTSEFISALLLPKSFHKLTCNYSQCARTTRGRILNALPTNAPRGILLLTQITDLVRHKFQSQCSKKKTV